MTKKHHYLMGIALAIGILFMELIAFPHKVYAEYNQEVSTGVVPIVFYTESGRVVAVDLDTYDINVKEKDPMNGVSYFEDEGDSIDDRTDYFDTYFKEPTERRSGIGRALSTVGAYVGIALRHIGLFFKNIFSTLTGKGKR